MTKPIKNYTITKVNIINYAFVLILWLSSSVLAQSSFKPKTIIGLNSTSRIPNEYIVVLKEDEIDKQALILALTSQITLEQALEIIVNDICTDLALISQGTIETVYTAALYGFALDNGSEQAVSDIVNDSRVKYVEVNQSGVASTTQLNPTWGLDRIDQQDLPLNNSYIYNQDGTGVTVYVVDSGVRVADLDFGSRASWGANFIIDDVGEHDCTGHGTHVAGIIAGSTYGVAKNVGIKALRVLDCMNRVTGSDLIAAMNWIMVNKSEPAVINISTAIQKSLSVNEAVNNIVDEGVTVVVAAGNANQSACNFSPASATGAITVGATTILDARSFFSGSGASNFGSCVDIFAPGSDIVSLGIDSPTIIQSGTSFSSPHVAGAAALFLQEDPQATPAEVKQAIVTSASNIMIGNAGVDSPNKVLNITNLLVIPDIYEEDDTDFSNNNTIGINNPPQQHTFSDDSTDWIRLIDQPLSSELNLTDGYCDNLSCGIELSNITDVDLCLQFAKPGLQSSIACGLSDGFYTNIEMIQDNLSNSQCDTRYNLGWSHVKLMDNQNSPNADKAYDIRFSCTYDEHVELPEPDIYENDDNPYNLSNFSLPFIGSITQSRNFSDDSFDWLRFSSLAVACANTTNSCKFNFSNLGSSNDLCIELETSTEFCNIQEGIEYQIIRPHKGAPLLIHNLGTIDNDTNYTFTAECGCF